MTEADLAAIIVTVGIGTVLSNRIVHRTVHKGSWKKLREWAEKTYAIRYTDGTSLCLTVRDCKPRERVQEIHGYDSLIRDCCYHNVSAVADLPQRPVPHD